jgi:hypothetical protein
VKKLYVHEIQPNGEVSTVGLFYSTEEAEDIVEKLRELAEKKSCKYEITETAISSGALTSKEERRPLARK